MVSLRPSRYIGLLGSGLLAIAAYLGGALPHADLRSTLGGILGAPRTATAVGVFLAGLGLWSWAWVRLSRARLTLSWVTGTVALWAVPLLCAPPLASRDTYAYACQGAGYAAGRSPYVEGVAALPCPWLDTVSFIWRDTPAPYGPGFVLLAGAAAALAGGSLLAAVLWLRLVAVVGVAVAAAGIAAVARACGVDPGRALWLALAGPLVGVHLVSGAHNDGLMIGLVVWGLAVAAGTGASAGLGWWRAGWWRAVAVGGLFGLALAIKVTAVVVLPFAVLLLAPVRRLAGGRRAAPRRVRAVLGLGAVAFAAAGAVLAGVGFLGGLGWGWLGGLVSSGDSKQWTSLPTGVGIAVDYLVPGTGWSAVPATRALGVVALAVVLAVLFVRTWRGPATGGDGDGGNVGDGELADSRRVAYNRRIVAAAGWAWACTVLLAPVFHPWYALWPIIVLSAAGTARTLVVVSSVALAFLVLPDGFNLARVTKLPGALLMVGLAGWLLWRAASWLLPVRGESAGR